jgi:hypothetical protein
MDDKDKNVPVYQQWKYEGLKYNHFCQNILIVSRDPVPLNTDTSVSKRFNAPKCGKKRIAVNVC